jgi:hypothetical protein
MNDPSVQQGDIIDAALEPLSVVACAGSGKTITAVRRLTTIRRLIREERGRVALLSFSNVAVEVFGRSYLNDKTIHASSSLATRVCIDTFDSFITTNILRPHGSRTMGCACLPFLVFGGEPFLENTQFKFWINQAEGKKFPVPDISKVEVELAGDQLRFCYRPYSGPVAINNGLVATQSLGKVGAYTHALGRYWVYRTLKNEPKILAALAHRYPHIIVDEAQDVGSIHQAILELLAIAGSQITLVGDPNQAIFGFCGADGEYLKSYAARQGVTVKALTTNYRSVPNIVAVANSLSGRFDVADRETPAEISGAFFVVYKPAELNRLLFAYQQMLKSADLLIERSAIVCRANKQKRELRNYSSGCGQGLTKLFTSAVIARDSATDFQEAFEIAARCIVSLLKRPPEHICVGLLDTSRYPEFRAIRRAIWEFTRDCQKGLPSGLLIADSAWHPQLLTRVKALLSLLEAKFGYAPVDNLGSRLKKTGLPNSALIANDAEKSVIEPTLRIETIHGVKGESLDAILYLAEKEHVKGLVAGTSSEIGRIGYVAVTRARNLFWLGITEDVATQFRAQLAGHGFIEMSIEDAELSVATEATASSAQCLPS